MAFQKVGDILHGDRAQPYAPRTARIAPENDEQQAAALRRLDELAGQPLLDERGQVIYHCRACKDMKWLRADVPYNHPLFGKVRMCPCSSQFDLYGGRWFAPGDLFHRG